MFGDLWRRAGLSPSAELLVRLVENRVLHGCGDGDIVCYLFGEKKDYY